LKTTFYGTCRFATKADQIQTKKLTHLNLYRFGRMALPLKKENPDKEFNPLPEFSDLFYFANLELKFDAHLHSLI